MCDIGSGFLDGRFVQIPQSSMQHLMNEYIEFTLPIEIILDCYHSWGAIEWIAFPIASPSIDNDLLEPAKLESLTANRNCTAHDSASEVSLR